MASKIKKAILAASIALISSQAHSEIIVDTGPSSGTSYGIYDTSANDFQKFAGKFVLQSGYTITDVFASLVYYSWATPSAKVNVSIYSNQNNEPSSSLFTDKITVKNLSSNDQWVGLSNISLDLSAGTYWVVFSGIKGEPNQVGWAMYGATNPLSEYRIMNTANGYPYQWLYLTNETPGLKILGTPLATVPEPENLAMLLAGLGLLGVAVRRNK